MLIQQPRPHSTNCSIQEFSNLSAKTSELALSSLRLYRLFDRSPSLVLLTELNIKTMSKCVMSTKYTYFVSVQSVLNAWLYTSLNLV